MDRFTTVRDKFINDASGEGGRFFHILVSFYLVRGGRNLHIGAGIIQCVSKTWTIARTNEFIVRTCNCFDTNCMP